MLSSRTSGGRRASSNTSVDTSQDPRFNELETLLKQAHNHSFANNANEWNTVVRMVYFLGCTLKFHKELQFRIAHGPFSKKLEVYFGRKSECVGGFELVYCEEDMYVIRGLFPSIENDEYVNLDTRFTAKVTYVSGKSEESNNITSTTIINGENISCVEVNSPKLDHKLEINYVSGNINTATIEKVKIIKELRSLLKVSAEKFRQIRKILPNCSDSCCSLVFFLVHSSKYHENLMFSLIQISSRLEIWVKVRCIGSFELNRNADQTIICNLFPGIIKYPSVSFIRAKEDASPSKLVKIDLDKIVVLQIDYESERSYIGPVHLGPPGEGCIMFKDKRLYTGSVSSGIPNGQGSITLKEDVFVTGIFEDGNCFNGTLSMGIYKVKAKYEKEILSIYLPENDYDDELKEITNVKILDDIYYSGEMKLVGGTFIGKFVMGTYLLMKEGKVCGDGFTFEGKFSNSQPYFGKIIYKDGRIFDGKVTFDCSPIEGVMTHPYGKDGIYSVTYKVMNREKLLTETQIVYNDASIFKGTVTADFLPVEGVIIHYPGNRISSVTYTFVNREARLTETEICYKDASIFRGEIAVLKNEVIEDFLPIKGTMIHYPGNEIPSVTYTFVNGEKLLTETVIAYKDGSIFKGTVTANFLPIKGIIKRDLKEGDIIYTRDIGEDGQLLPTAEFKFSDGKTQTLRLKDDDGLKPHAILNRMSGTISNEELSVRNSAATTTTN